MSTDKVFQIIILNIYFSWLGTNVGSSACLVKSGKMRGKIKKYAKICI